jgi:hypothetical protein
MNETPETVEHGLDSYIRIWREKRDARYLPAAVEAKIDEGNKEEALGLCMEGISLGEMSSTLGVLAGGLLVSLGRNEEAAKILGDVISEDPGNFEASRLLRVLRAERVNSVADPMARTRPHDILPTGDVSNDAPASFRASAEEDPEDNPVLRRIREIVESIE